MEELKTIIEMVKDLPGTVLWILGGFLFYKLFLAGSITAAVYGGFKLAVIKWHDCITTKAHAPVKRDYYGQMKDLCITGCEFDIIDALRKIRNTGCKIDSKYIHDADVKWLYDAIAEKAVSQHKKCD